jgi:hypothetical protein
MQSGNAASPRPNVQNAADKSKITQEISKVKRRARNDPARSWYNRCARLRNTVAVAPRMRKEQHKAIGIPEHGQIGKQADEHFAEHRNGGLAGQGGEVCA